MRNRTITVLSIISFLFLSPQVLFCQNHSQTVRGKVLDTETRQPLIGAVITLSEALNTISDENGEYRLEEVPVGRYQLQVDFIGYQSFVLHEVLVESGKEVIFNIELEPKSEELSEVIVRSSKSDYRVTHPLSVRTITVEETLRFPATYFDPARLMTTYPGVVSQNDQANGISVRGNSPNAISWRLEGMEIVNPNHTPNAGTITDRITQNGGGVNILSAQVLGTSNFFTGAFPSNFNNALAGVMDMKFREGNNEQHEFTVQAGLIGFDIAAEGPIKSLDNDLIRDVSFLVNYRYSFTGLLAAMGLDFGGESISFQDLSFSVDMTLFNKGRYKIFGMGGLSENIFEAERDTSLWEFQFDNHDISFDSRMGAIGLLANHPFKNGGTLKYGSVLSGLRSTRVSEILTNDLTVLSEPFATDFQKQTKLVYFTSYEKKLAGRSYLLTGFNGTSTRNIVSASGVGLTDFINGQINWNIYSLYTNWRNRLGSNLELNLGLHLNYFQQGDNDSFYPEPRASLLWQLDGSKSISAAYGLHSQELPPQLFNQGSNAEALGLSRAHHMVLSYKQQFKTASYWSAEVFYQSLFDIPIAADASNSFSAINVVEGYFEGALVNAGIGTNYGLELTYQKYLSDDFYLMCNGTYYESKYEGSDGVERDTRYNGNYIFNATGGKEWQWAKEKERKKGTKEVDAILGLNLRVAYLGGFRDTPIDVEASAAAGQTVYIDEQAFEIVQDAFFRTDLRVYYKRSKSRSSSTWALDIQNLTNKENAAFSYYDTAKNAIVAEYQLSLIPILSYRVEF